MTDHDDFAALSAHLGDFDMHLGNEWAGRIENTQAARFGITTHALRYAMRRENQRTAGGYIVEFFDEYGTFVTQVFDDELVMHDFVAHVDRRAVDFECALDDGDGALDASAEATWVGEQHFGIVDHGVVHEYYCRLPSRLLHFLCAFAVTIQITPIISTSTSTALPAMGWLKSISASVSVSSRTSPG